MTARNSKLKLASSIAALALVVGGASWGVADLLTRSADTAPPPATVSVVVPTGSQLSRELKVQDCPTEDVMDMICVWDSKTGRDFVAVYGEIFWVGRNDDGTLWVDNNHDGEPGYTDS